MFSFVIPSRREAGGYVSSVGPPTSEILLFKVLVGGL